MSMVVVVVIVLVIALGVWYSMSNSGFNFGFGQGNTATITRITPQEYQTGYAKRDHLLVDVRTPEEFRSGHIPGAKNIALQDLPRQMATLSKEQPIIVYCRSGARSNSAAQMLTKAGFGNVYDLGGIMTWQAQGLPVQ